MLIPKNASAKGVILPIVTSILLSGALGLAIIDREVRPAYFHLLETLIVCGYLIPKKPDDNGK
jgi:hypothetical protein